MKIKINKNSIKKIISSIIYTVLIIVLCVVLMQKLSNNRISFWGYRIFKVISESMMPEYKINDILLVKDIKTENIKIGDNLSYLKEMSKGVNVIITHKVVGIEKDRNGNRLFHTKGIANITEDPVVKEEQIYGVVVNKIYSLSVINKLINNIFGFILLVFVPLLLMIYSCIKDLITMVKEK